jgi:hypothetical protein
LGLIKENSVSLGSATKSGSQQLKTEQAQMEINNSFSPNEQQIQNDAKVNPNCFELIHLQNNEEIIIPNKPDYGAETHLEEPENNNSMGDSSKNYKSTGNKSKRIKKKNINSWGVDKSSIKTLKKKKKEISKPAWK